jgi:hypothetical protein
MTDNSTGLARPYHGLDWRATLILTVMMLAGPIAWSLSLFLKYALASNTCSYLPPGSNENLTWLWSWFIVIDVCALVITGIAAWLSYQSWSATRHESPGHIDTVSEIGEGRKRFLALWGLLIAMLFGSAIIFSFVVDVAVPPCVS